MHTHNSLLPQHLTKLMYHAKNKMVKNLTNVCHWHTYVWVEGPGKRFPNDKRVIVRRAGLMRSQQDSERWWSVPFTCAWLYMSFCPACRTYLIATRFWVVVICPVIKCLTVLEFSFILFDLCLFITIFNFILNYVPIVTFWIFTYHKIWILLIIFCLYEIIELFIF